MRRRCAKRQPLDGVAQRRLVRRGALVLPEAVEARPADPGQPAQPLDRRPPCDTVIAWMTAKTAARQTPRPPAVSPSYAARLPKKIEIRLLLADLALEFGDPSPRRRTFIEDRASRAAVQRPLARTPGTRSASSPPCRTCSCHSYIRCVDLQIRRHADAASPAAIRSTARRLSSVETTLGRFIGSSPSRNCPHLYVSLSGCTPGVPGETTPLSVGPAQRPNRVDSDQSGLPHMIRIDDEK